VTRYCEVKVSNRTATPRISTDNKEILKLSLGNEEQNFNFKDTSILIQLKNVDDLTTSTDLLNHMTKSGWELVNIIPHTNNYVMITIYYFKREFDKSNFQ
jgi:hypothetical protein